MAESRGNPLPDEADVRALVRRVVESVVEPGATPPSAAPARAAASVAPARSAPPVAPAGIDRGPSPSGGDRVSIAIGSDHGGFQLKSSIARALAEQGHDVHDCGTGSEDAVDYPDFAHAVARLVADGTCTWGIVVDGAGIGSAMVANKVPGVRAALCYDLSTARNSREHNHANVLTLGARLIGPGLALDVVKEWLATPWGSGRHAARVEKINEIERRYLREPARETRRA